MGLTRYFDNVVWISAAQLAVSLAILTSVGLDEIKRLEARTWPTVQGKVVHSSYGRSNSGKGTSYRPEVYYEYAIADRTFHASRIQTGPEVVSSKNEVERLVARYPVGKAVAVYYSPRKPSDAVLDPAAQSSGGFWEMAVGLGFLMTAILTIASRFF